MEYVLVYQRFRISITDTRTVRSTDKRQTINSSENRSLKLMKTPASNRIKCIVNKLNDHKTKNNLSAICLLFDEETVQDERANIDEGNIFKVEYKIPGQEQ